MFREFGVLRCYEESLLYLYVFVLVEDVWRSWFFSVGCFLFVGLVGGFVVDWLCCWVEVMLLLLVFWVFGKL